MIKANDLRIGNLVADQSGNIITVESINYDGVNLEIEQEWFEEESTVENLSPDYTFDAVFGIPLTLEILEKAGFKGNTLAAQHNDIVFYENHFGIKGMLGIVKPNNVNFLHQLQNLFFSITGEELTINLEEAVKK